VTPIRPFRRPSKRPPWMYTRKRYTPENTEITEGDMAKNLATKILEAHLVEGGLKPGAEISIAIDHTLLQDATGTMAMLEFIAMGLPRVKVGLAAQYIDHNLLQTDY